MTLIAGPLLTADLLEELAERWRALGAPIADSLRPGLSDAEMDALVAPLGLRLPIEARVWWGCHDRTEVGRISHGVGNYIVPLRLAHAVKEHGQVLADAAVVTADDDCVGPDYFWRRDWLPFASPPRALLAVDCSVADSSPTPIRHVEFELPAESQNPVAGSLGAVVWLWIEAMDCGAWTYDPDFGPGWRSHPERLPDVQGWARNLIA